MGRHTPRGVLTGEELNVIGTDSKRPKNHRMLPCNFCARFKSMDGRLWAFWPSNARPTEKQGALLHQATNSKHGELQGMLKNVVPIHERRRNA